MKKVQIEVLLAGAEVLDDEWFEKFLLGTVKIAKTVGHVKLELRS